MAAHAFSIEVTRPPDAELARLRDWLAPDTPVYLSRVPAETSAEQAAAAVRIRAAGYEPVPHIAARRLASADDLADFLARVCGGAGVRRALVIAGDSDRAGPYEDALAVIRRGGLREAGIAEIGIAGHPEGHPAISRAALERAMADKIAAAAEAGLRLHIVSQFSFAPDRIVTWLRALRAGGISAPVKAGMAGPTKLSALLRYAARCGVAASAQGLLSGAASALVGQVMKPVGPDRILDALRAAGPEIGEVAPHYFSFGGVVETARYASGVERQREQHAIKLAN